MCGTGPNPNINIAELRIRYADSVSLNIIQRYEAVLKRIAKESQEHFASSLANAALNGWDPR